MSVDDFKIIDNIKNVNDDTLRGDKGCFEIEEVFNVGISYIDNYISAWGLFKDFLTTSFDNPKCSEIEAIITKAREIKENNEVVFSDLRSYLKCTIISNFDIDAVLANVFEELGLNSLSQLLKDYENQYTKILDDMENLTDFESLDSFESANLERLESIQEGFNTTFQSVLNTLTDHLLDLFNVEDETTKTEIKEEIGYIDIREIDTPKDFFDLIFNILKVALKIGNTEDEREIALSEEDLHFKTFEYNLEKFISTYFDDMLDLLSGNTIDVNMDLEAVKNNIEILNKFEKYMDFFNQDFENIIFKFIEKLFITVMYDVEIDGMQGNFMCEIEENTTIDREEGYSETIENNFNVYYKRSYFFTEVYDNDCFSSGGNESLNYTDFCSYVSSTTNDGLENFRTRAKEYIELYVQKEFECINNIGGVLQDYANVLISDVTKQQTDYTYSYGCEDGEDIISTTYTFRPVIRINNYRIQSQSATEEQNTSKKLSAYNLYDYETKPIIIDDVLNEENETPLKMYEHIKNNIDLDFLFKSDIELQVETSLINVLDDFKKELDDMISDIYKTATSWFESLD